MAQWQVSGEYVVEVLFEIKKDSHGYPENTSTESLLARPLREDSEHFLIESIPFYLKNICREDVVKARTIADPEDSTKRIFSFEKIIHRGGHNTYRLLLSPTESSDAVSAEIEERGCLVEAQYGNFMAVDVPPSVDQSEVDRFFSQEANRKRWQVQDGLLQSIRTL